MEPWDGPTAIAYTNGKQIGASLDRNGLRPARFYMTEDNRIVLSSEVGVVDIEPEKIVRKGRLAPGEMIYVDLEKHQVLFNEDIKRNIANKFPYREWLNDSLVQLKGPVFTESSEELDEETLLKFQLANGYTKEETMKNILPMVTEQKIQSGRWVTIRRLQCYRNSLSFCSTILNSCLRRSRTRRLMRFVRKESHRRHLI